MLKRSALPALLALAVFLAGSGLEARAQRALPRLTGHVVDETGTLTAEERASLERTLANYEARKGTQVVVLLVDSTEPESIEQFSIRVAEAWKLGRRGVDDGVILLAAMRDHSIRIEVGYGLEGVLPDAIAKRIIAEIIAPRFRDGAYAAGIQAGVERILSVTEGEPLPAPQRQRGGTEVDGALIVLVALGILIGLLIRVVLFGRPAARTVVGASSAVSLFVAGLILAGLVAAAAGAFALFMASMGGSGAGWVGGRGGMRGGGLGGGLWSGMGGLGGGGLGGFGGGGFGGGISGGGGGFGGGGASGSW